MGLSATEIERYDAGAPTREDTETATFALGCFWGPDARFGALDGVVRTRVGYAGGSKADPSYHDLGDHSEAVQVDYDPETITYADLLDLAFRSHDHARQPTKRQYQNVVFVSTPAQRDALQAYLDDRGLSFDGIETRIERLDAFYPAEEYHQKHSLRAKRAVLNAFEAAGYDAVDVRESPAAAKLNGRAAGCDLPDGHAFAVPNRSVYTG
ncbi:MAG: peptide-methionine (S)-S-oxide reductase MsrA [Halohasta sp.]